MFSVVSICSWWGGPHVTTVQNCYSLLPPDLFKLVHYVAHDVSISITWLSERLSCLLYFQLTIFCQLSLTSLLVVDGNVNWSDLYRLCKYLFRRWDFSSIRLLTDSNTFHVFHPRKQRITLSNETSIELQISCLNFQFEEGHFIFVKFTLSLAQKLNWRNCHLNDDRAVMLLVSIQSAEICWQNGK